MPLDETIDEASIRALMKAAHIPGISVAFVSGKTISRMTLGKTDAKSTTPLAPVTPETVFGAASLSKPVFAFLVLKLIENNTFTLDTNLDEILPFTEFFKQFCKENNFKKGAIDTADIVRIKKLTVGMVLSHKTGIPIGYNDKAGPLKLQFEPGNEYGYSGIPIYYLQKVIEKLTGKSLEQLAQKHVFKPLKMNNSSFYPPEPGYMAATEASKLKIRKKYSSLETTPELSGKDKLAHGENSLHTTASDYALFIIAWLYDNKLQYAFSPQVSMMQDKWAVNQEVSVVDLEKVAWGFGWGLQTDHQGVATAYHTGDMNQWRASVAMNLKDKTAVVYFSNSYNGHILADKIISSQVNLSHGLNYFFQKYGFARNFAELRPDWQSKPSFGLAKPKAEVKTQACQVGTESLDAKKNSTAQMIKSLGGVNKAGVTVIDDAEVPSEMKATRPSYMAPTKSSTSKSKKREKDSIFHPIPKLPWK